LVTGRDSSITTENGLFVRLLGLGCIADDQLQILEQHFPRPDRRGVLLMSGSRTGLFLVDDFVDGEQIVVG
jgi:hypothetical protein